MKHQKGIFFAILAISACLLLVTISGLILISPMFSAGSLSNGQALKTLDTDDFSRGTAIFPTLELPPFPEPSRTEVLVSLESPIVEPNPTSTLNFSSAPEDFRPYPIFTPDLANIKTIPSTSLESDLHLPNATLPALTNTSLPSEPVATPTPIVTIQPTEPAIAVPRIIGYSGSSEEYGEDPLPIISYQFKNGPNKVLFVGGVHGGYEWNTIKLAYEMIDYFTKNAESIPDSITLIIIPSANPFGQKIVTGKVGPFDPSDVQGETFRGRFNARNVDINRNFDCEWSEEAYWRDKKIAAGEYAFSEPETEALRDYIYEIEPLAVIFWHSVANGIFGARCNGEVFNASIALAQVYAEGSKYPVYETFTAYQITGDASDWLVLESIPSITVELATSDNSESERNLAGVLGVLNFYRDWPVFLIPNSE